MATYGVKSHREQPEKYRGTRRAGDYEGRHRRDESLPYAGKHRAGHVQPVRSTTRQPTRAQMKTRKQRQSNPFASFMKDLWWKGGKR